MKQIPWTVAALVAVLAAASPSRAAAADSITVCHKPDGHALLVSVDASALPAHLAHGDYVATLLVSHSQPAAGDGVHFDSIGAALQAAHDSRVQHGEGVSAACRISILVDSGVYYGSTDPAAGETEHFPLIVDVPDITLQGALQMSIDTTGRPTGVAATAAITSLVPLEPLPVVNASSTPLIVVNAHPGGSTGDGFIVEGFDFQSGHDPAVDAGGQAIWTLRVGRVVIQGNRFDAGFTESLDLRAGSADVIQNYLSGTAGTCDICLSGPGAYRAIGNRLLAGGIPGITVDGPVALAVPAGIEPFPLPAEADTSATIVNNEVRDHQRLPVGVGIRVDALGTNASSVRSTVHAVIHDNLLVNNRFGMIIHAAFPAINTPLKGDLDVTLGGNVIEQSCQAPLLISFSRHTTALGLTNNPYLQNSTFQIALNGDVDWNDVWYGNPAGFGNTLIVDGTVIPNGIRQFYSAATCPGN